MDHEGEHASRWAAVSSIAAKINCTAQTLHEWVKKAERDDGVRAGVPTDVATKLKALERENRELRQANEIPAQGESAYFAQAEVAAGSGHDCLHRRSPPGAWGPGESASCCRSPCRPIRPCRKARRSLTAVRSVTDGTLP